jgi:response regulator of citrate/malate metabolism
MFLSSDSSTDLPDGRGFDLAVELRNGAFGEAMQDVRIVVVSADATSAAHESWVKITNVTFALKPFSVDCITRSLQVDSPV